MKWIGFVAWSAVGAFLVLASGGGVELRGLGFTLEDGEAILLGAAFFLMAVLNVIVIGIVEIQERMGMR